MLRGGRRVRGDAASARYRCRPSGVVLRCLLAMMVVAAACSGTGYEDPETGPFTMVAAGGEHACGLRTDNTIVCWGNNASGQVDVPRGEFRDVVVGGEHTCALRRDRTAVCWGSSAWGQSRAPDGEFRAIAAGNEHSCGVRTSGAIVCWGGWRWRPPDAPAGIFREIAAGAWHSCAVRANKAVICWGHDTDGQVAAPEGEFSTVDAGQSHSCGLRTDATISCWGSNVHGQSDAPEGFFTAVGVGLDHSCGLRTDATISCWGSNVNGESDAPEGSFTSLSLGQHHSCGLRTGGIIICWGDHGDDRAAAPAGQFSAVAAGERHSCGVRSDSAIVCWGDDRYGKTYVPEGQFSTVAAGSYHSCGLRTDDTVACWGYDQSEVLGHFSGVAAGHAYSCGLLRSDQAIVCWGEIGTGVSDPPEGRFTQVSAGSWHACAVRADKTADCWGHNSNGQVLAPEGEFVAVAAGGWHSCGLRTDKSIRCWGAILDDQTAPRGEFDAVVSGMRHSCGLRVDGTVECWGADEAGQSSAPDGRFSAVTAGGKHSCGLRVDGTVECWGIEWTPVPVGVRNAALVDQADPAKCRPLGVPEHVTAGFPRPTQALKADRTLRVAVLFVDFTDAAAGYPVHDEAEMGLPFMAENLESSSYQRLDVEFVPLRRWLRAEHSHDHYLQDVYGSRALSDDIRAEAVRLADPHFDFNEIDLLMVVMPSAYFRGGVAGGQVETGEGVVDHSLSVNVFPNADGEGPHPWGWVATHEFLHNLGLVDMYMFRFDPAELSVPLAGETLIYGAFGYMSLYALYPRPSTDLPPTAVVQDPDGSSSRTALRGSTASEMLAWSRWQLGWLDEDRVLCISEEHASFTLAPVAAPGPGIAMAAIPLSEHEVIVLESRRQIGIDLTYEIPLPNGGRIVQPALLAEGVLAYTVDASIGSGDMPIRLLGDTGDQVVDDYPILGVGDSAIVRGYTIAVVADDGDTHTVSVIKAQD